jgi:hypothetical protein
MEPGALYDLFGGIAFLLLAGAHTLAVIVLRTALPETAVNPSRSSASVRRTVVTDPSVVRAIERRMEEGRNMRSRYLRDLLRPAN